MREEICTPGGMKPKNRQRRCEDRTLQVPEVLTTYLLLTTNPSSSRPSPIKPTLSPKTHR